MDLPSFCDGVAADVDVDIDSHGLGFHAAAASAMLAGPCPLVEPHNELFPDIPHQDDRSDSISGLDFLTVAGGCWRPGPDLGEAQHHGEAAEGRAQPTEPGFWPEGAEQVAGMCPSAAGGWPGSSEEDRQVFVASLARFLAAHPDDSGRVVNGRLKLPVVGGRVLDVCTLYRQVVRMGGHGAVTAQKQWRSLRDCCHLPASHTAVSNTLRKHYEKLLLAYEAAHFKPAQRFTAGASGGGGSSVSALARTSAAGGGACSGLASDDEHSGASTLTSVRDGGPAPAGGVDCGATSGSAPAAGGARLPLPYSVPPPVKHPGRKVAARNQIAEVRGMC